MKQRRTSTYITRICLCSLLCYLSGYAQDPQGGAPPDSLEIKNTYGLRVGGDVGKLLRSFVDDTYTGFELSADYRIRKNWYLAGEMGTEEKKTVNPYLKITTQGSYVKGGVDYNLYKNWIGMDNMIYVGFRFGVSRFSQIRDGYTVYNTNSYWAPQYTSNDAKKYDGLNAFFGTLIFGTKVQLFSNVYLGLNVQLHVLVKETVPDNFQNVYIPGFHKTYDDSRNGFGYGYTLSYCIPLYKKSRK